MKIRVYYEDTDAAGVVYHSNYIKYCDRARSEILFSNNIILDEEHGYFVVKSLDANYIKSAVLADDLYITSKVIKQKKASLVFNHCIYKNDVKLFEANITLAYIKNKKISAIPKNILNINI